MRKINKILTSAAFATGIFLMNPVGALAADNQINIGPQGDFANLGAITFPNLIQGAIKLVLLLAAIIFFFILVIGGIQWITSGGDKTGAEGARKRITNALIGLAIVFVAWAILNLLGTMFGIGNLQLLNIPNFTNNQ